MRLPHKEVEEFRAETNQSPTIPNISWEEIKAIKELKEDRGRVILTVGKGVARVVMDRQDYSNKAHQSLADNNTYRLSNKDPTNKLKNRLVQTPRDIKSHGGLNDS